MDDKLNKLRDALKKAIFSIPDEHLVSRDIIIHAMNSTLAALDAEPVASSVQPAQAMEKIRLPERVIDTLLSSAGVSTFHPDGSQLEKMYQFAHDVAAEVIARIPTAQPAQVRVVPEAVLNKIIDLACEAKTGWLKSQSDDGAEGTKGSEIYHARKSDIRAMLSASPALPRQGEKGDGAGITSWQERARIEGSGYANHCYHMQAEINELRAALAEIAQTKNLTATDAQFSRHLQKMASNASKGSAAPLSNQPEQDQLCQLGDDAHEIWAAAQLLPNEGIEDGVARISSLLSSRKESKDAGRLMTLLKKLCKSHPNTLRTLYCDGEPVGKLIVEFVKAQVWIGRPLDGNGPTMRAYTADDAQNLRAMGYSLNGPYSTLDSAIAAQQQQGKDGE